MLDQIGRPVVLIGASMGGLTGILAAHEAGPEVVTKLVLVDVVPRFEKDGSARIRDFMASGLHGFDSLEQAADAVAAYLPHRTKPRSPEGLKKNLRLRDGRWYWHWDPAFLTKPGDDPFARVEKLEQAAIDLEIPILLIRGKLSDVVSDEGVKDFLAKVPHAEFVELSDAGHTAAGDDNDAFSEVVVQVRQSVTTGFNFLAQPELPAPQVSEAAAEKLCLDHYGLSVRAESLGSQQDKNFLIWADGDTPARRAQDREPGVHRRRTGGAGRGGRADRRHRADAARRGTGAEPGRAARTTVTGLFDGDAHVRLLPFLPVAPWSTRIPLTRRGRGHGRVSRAGSAER